MRRGVSSLAFGVQVDPRVVVPRKLALFEAAFAFGHALEPHTEAIRDGASHLAFVVVRMRVGPAGEGGIGTIFGMPPLETTTLWPWCRSTLQLSKKGLARS